MIKKLSCFLLVLALALSFSYTNYASAATIENLSNETALSQEILNEAKVALKSENFKNYLNQIEELGTKNATLQISDNLILKKTTTKSDASKTLLDGISKSSNTATAYKTTITSTYSLESIVGITVATLKVVGEFYRNGSTVQATDCNGTVSTSYIGWSGETVDESMLSGSTSGYSWAKSKFSLEYYIGVDPVGMTLQTVEVVGKVFCNPNGSYYSSWS